MSLVQIARLIIILGVFIIIVGGLLYLIAQIGFPLGKLPGDIRIERGNMTCIAPLATTLLLSILLTLLLNIVIRIFNR
jgi:hypothetical protein